MALWGNLYIRSFLNACINIHEVNIALVYQLADDDAMPIPTSECRVGNFGSGWIVEKIMSTGVGEGILTTSAWR